MTLRSRFKSEGGGALILASEKNDDGEGLPSSSSRSLDWIEEERNGILRRC